MENVKTFLFICFLFMHHIFQQPINIGWSGFSFIYIRIESGCADHFFLIQINFIYTKAEFAGAF